MLVPGIKSHVLLQLFSLSLLSPFRLAGYVEALASRLGMQIPDLSPKQADMWQTRVSSHSVSNHHDTPKAQLCSRAVTPSRLSTPE